VGAWRGIGDSAPPGRAAAMEGVGEGICGGEGRMTGKAIGSSS
jgi:hypothetical protein